MYEFTITSRYLSHDDTRVTRTYWVPSSGGYVHDVTERPGTLGPQVFDERGHALEATPETLPRVIRRELARRRYRDTLTRWMNRA